MAIGGDWEGEIECNNFYKVVSLCKDMAFCEEEWLALDMNFIRDLVKSDQGKYSRPDLTRKFREHYTHNNLQDPGFNFGTYIVEDMVKSGILELKPNTDSSACTHEKCYIKDLKGDFNKNNIPLRSLG